MIKNIKARLFAKRYNIWKEEIDSTHKEGYYIYNDVIYFGNRLGVFFISCQKRFRYNDLELNNLKK
jgi:hypothetical protein